MNPEIAIIRRQICESKGCEYLGRLAYDDPCAACPAGHWGQYTRVGCEDAGARAIPSRRSWLPGPGTLLTRGLSRLGLHAGGGCSCKQRAAQMDVWGWWKSLKQWRTITTWLVGSARQLGHYRLGNRRVAIGLLGVLLVELTRERPKVAPTTKKEYRRG